MIMIACGKIRKSGGSLSWYTGKYRIIRRGAQTGGALPGTTKVAA
jgi:hypothetical protein